MNKAALIKFGLTALAVAAGVMLVGVLVRMFPRTTARAAAAIPALDGTVS